MKIKKIEKLEMTIPTIHGSELPWTYIGEKGAKQIVNKLNELVEAFNKREKC